MPSSTPSNRQRVLAEIEDRLHRYTGMHFRVSCPQAVELGVQRRMHELHLASIDDYLRLLSSSSQEQQLLVEETVVPETWFLREEATFRRLAQFGRELSSNRDRSMPIRILSLPCSTGEEPYSAIMCLLEAGLPLDRISVTAVDISARAIRTAQSGIYGDYSFRNVDPAFRDRHFRRVEGGYRIAEPIPSTVRWLPMRFQEASRATLGLFDIILCRNLLIYFDAAERRKSVERLTSMLEPEGTLFVAAAETRYFRSSSLRCHRSGEVFTFHHQPRSSSSVTRSLESAARPREIKPLEEGVSSHPKADQLLDQAQRLADRGELSETEALCKQAVEDAGPTAKAFYLLGLARDSAGDAEGATEFYRKALYLEPEHAETLLHWSWLKRRMGDVSGAKMLQQRADRLLGKNESPEP